jgi:cholesterol transport system auxiliary component
MEPPGKRLKRVQEVRALMADKSLLVFAGRLAVPVVSVMVASCSFERPPSVTLSTYDLGPPPVYSKLNPDIPGTVLIPPVRAPTWLDDPEIVYRLLYEDRSRPQSYAMSRWAADPAALITDRLRSRFAAASRGVITPGDSAGSDFTLRVQLDDFSQRFETPGQSHATLRARATLLSTADRKLLAQRTFDIDRPAEANAAGAVKALAEAADAFVEDLMKWTAQNVRVSGEQQTKP